VSSPCGAGLPNVIREEITAKKTARKEKTVIAGNDFEALTHAERLEEPIYEMKELVREMQCRMKRVSSVFKLVSV
jgi:hypothetical protein